MHFISTYVLGSPRVYHPVLHTGDHAHLRGDCNNDYLYLYQICFRVEFISFLPMATLGYMMARFAIDKAVTLFFFIVGLWTLFFELGLVFQFCFLDLLFLGLGLSSTTLALEESCLAFLALSLFLLCFSILIWIMTFSRDIFFFVLHITFIVFPKI